MQRFLNASVVAVWIVVLLCGRAVISDESCDKGSTATVSHACTDRTPPATLTSAESETTLTYPTTTESENSDSEVHSPEQGTPATEGETDPAEEADDSCLYTPLYGENITSAELRGSWQVMSGYSREFVTRPFCPELTFDVDPENPRNVTVTWRGDDKFEDVLPHGEMIMDDTGKLMDKDGYHEMNAITLGQFLVLRVRNPVFWRVLYLYPTLDYRGSVLGDLLGFMMSTHSEFMNRDGPAWYICTQAYLPVE